MHPLLSFTRTVRFYITMELGIDDFEEQDARDNSPWEDDGRKVAYGHDKKDSIAPMLVQILSSNAYFLDRQQTYRSKLALYEEHSEVFQSVLSSLVLFKSCLDGCGTDLSDEQIAAHLPSLKRLTAELPLFPKAFGQHGCHRMVMAGADCAHALFEHLQRDQVNAPRLKVLKAVCDAIGDQAKRTSHAISNLLASEQASLALEAFDTCSDVDFRNGEMQDIIDFKSALCDVENMELSAGRLHQAVDKKILD